MGALIATWRLERPLVWLTLNFEKPVHRVPPMTDSIAEEAFHKFNGLVLSDTNISGQSIQGRGSRVTELVQMEVFLY